MKSDKSNPSSIFDLQAYKELYLTQARECLATLREHLDQLEQNPSDKRALREAHRAAHTLKGMSSTMHYHDLTALARSMEAPLRQAEFVGDTLTRAEITSLQMNCDEFKSGLDQLSPGESEPARE
jgi:two-component system chemotaxis sensor kinase CheA